MVDINIGQGARGIPVPGAQDASVKAGAAGIEPKLVGIFKGPNVSVMQGNGVGDFDKLLSELQLADEKTRINQLHNMLIQQITALSAKDAAAAAKAILLESQMKSIEMLIESMKPTKEELEAARRRKQTIEDSIKTKEQKMAGLATDLAAKEVLIATLDETEDAAQIAQLKAECAVIKDEIVALDKSIKQDNEDIKDLDKTIEADEQKLEAIEKKKDDLLKQFEDGFKSIQNAIKASGGTEVLTKLEAKLGVREDVDPVEEGEKRDEKLEGLGIVTDIFQAWSKALEGNVERREMEDEIDSKTQKMI